MRIFRRRVCSLAALALLAPAVALAQRSGERRPPHPGAPPPPFFGDFAASVHEAFGGKVVKGMPYKAEAVTEVAQSLADGNRIVRKTTAAVYRDGEGRTRREATLAAIGPLVASDAPRLVFIHDPVAGTSYVLEPDSRTARKLPSFSGHEPGRWKRREGEKPPPEGGGPGPAGHPGWGHEMREASRQSESLGTQTIEGLEATGTRTTVTIPAGAIGNEKPIAIVSERWFSPELQVVVQSSHRDPRFGDTTYRLTGISRGEQEKSLFEVPSDYAVKEGPPDSARFHRAPRQEEKQ